MDQQEHWGQLFNVALHYMSSGFAFFYTCSSLPSSFFPSGFTNQSLSQIAFYGPIMNDDKPPRRPGPKNSFNHC